MSAHITYVLRSSESSPSLSATVVQEFVPEGRLPETCPEKEPAGI